MSTPMPPEYVHQLTVSFADTNLVGNVYFAEYAFWQGKCREHFLIDHAPTVIDELASGDLALVTLNLNIEYLDECYAGDVIDIAMTVSARPTANRVSMEFQYRRDGNLVARGRQAVASMVKRDEQYVPCPLPEELRRALDQFTP